MANAVVLGLLEFIAILSCGYGLMELGAGMDLFGSLGLVYGSMWFLLGAASNVCGLMALYLMYYGAEDEISRGSQFWVQYHYLLAWLTIVLGYPTFLILMWMVHYPNPWVHAHMILSMIPLFSWMNRHTKAIVYTTQFVAVLAVVSHLWITALTGHYIGLIGAGVMLVNVTALSVPTKYNLWGFSSRELYVIGLSVTSVIFSQQVSQLLQNPIRIHSPFSNFKLFSDKLTIS